MTEEQRGLILITGATGSGKSTTLAAMLHHINTHFHKHVVTIEDPIEFVHEDIKAVIDQREIGTDTNDFQTALRHVVRQNPDVIFLGEMRDLETVQTAINAAQTGHLVAATMHTMDVNQTLERIINYFPEEQQAQIAQDLSLVLIGIVSQRLIAKKDAVDRVAAFEVLRMTPLARRLVANREIETIPEIIKAGYNSPSTAPSSSCSKTISSRLKPPPPPPPTRRSSSSSRRAWKLASTRSAAIPPIRTTASPSRSFSVTPSTTAHPISSSQMVQHQSLE